MEKETHFINLKTVEMKIYHGYDEIATLKGNVSIKETPFNFAVRSREGKITIYSKPEFGYQIITMDETDTERWQRTV